MAPACASGVQNFSPSTEDASFPPPPPTGPVDKKPTLTCEYGVIHGIHSPYYYSQLESVRESIRSGGCAQLALGASAAARTDLTPRGTDCQCGASDCSPVSFP
ncbi:hypothetical protein GCM10010306_055330 [Streptomyces umbrinus]|nr:hypothetical protein GCM10010306_055330 [Streptomyces umbrinus]